ncbi:MAG: zinc transporter ZntB [Sphingomonadales bacterium CG12_big_fil_rev_8_21_14_0_65_65_10]|nr:MAG: zinc transporter ZntB [Sphingomonadales bacterium CG12_big_fil_rev_8_21_14_0_65_65_10]
MTDNEAAREDDADGPLLFGRVLDGEGGARVIGWDEARDWKPATPGEIMWVHLCRNRAGVTEWLRDGLGLPEPTWELLVSDRTRPRAFREGGTLVATLRGINFNPGAQPEDMISMQLWCDGARLVTLRRHPMQSPRRVLKAIDDGIGPRDCGAIVTELAENLVTRMNAAIVDMNDHIDELEQADLEGDTDSMLDRITSIRRNCLALKRHMGPQHVALEAISREAPPWFEDHDRREIAETIDRLRRYLDDIDISKESAMVMQDELRARALAANERATYMLTIVAGIFLPLGFLTGLFGINVGGMPGLDDPDAFWWVVGLCIAIMFALYFLFRKLRWL